MATPVSDAMAGMTPAERAAYKATQFAARPAPDSLVAGSRIVAVNDVALVGANLQFNVALWIDSGVGFELIDTSGVNPVTVVNPPILVPDPSGEVVRSSEDPITHVVTESRYREDLDAALMDIAYAVTEKLQGSGGVM
jgi:hypothetical protein